MFKNLKIRTKFLVGFGIATVLIAIAVTIATFSLFNVGAEIEDIKSNDIPEILLLQGIKSDILEGLSAVLEYTVLNDLSQKQDFADHMDSAEGKLAELETILHDSPHEDKQEFVVYTQIVDFRSKLTQDAEEIFLRNEQGGDGYNQSIGELEEFAHEKLASLIDVFIESELKTVYNALSEVESANENSVTTVLILGTLSLIVIMLTSFIIYRSVVRSVCSVRNTAIEIAEGNMDVVIDASGSDEIAGLNRAINIMRESLKSAGYGKETKGKNLDE